MKATRWLCVPAVLGIVLSLFQAALTVEPKGGRVQRQQLHKTYGDGNYNDAYEGFRRLALDPEDDARQVGADLSMATQCLLQLNRADELDEFREAVIEVHAENWRLLQAAAQDYMSRPHHGFIVAGKFHRGNKRGGGRVANAAERDRVRALQLMARALPLARQDESRSEVSHFLLAVANVLLNNRGYGEAWRLQYLTELDELPDYDDGWGYPRAPGGAPVDQDGNPVLHRVPRRFEDAQTDGQRWRWCLDAAVEFDPRRTNEIRIQFADFLHNPRKLVPGDERQSHDLGPAHPADVRAAHAAGGHPHHHLPRCRVWTRHLLDPKIPGAVKNRRLHAILSEKPVLPGAEKKGASRGGKTRDQAQALHLSQ